ncbi:hypothetical protein BDZ89DRAFT_433498 [Hymenopellis radicata]|nr:hypothetical protein BDZ89DRAFT_433498 [Hymenopellis radicata]
MPTAPSRLQSPINPSQLHRQAPPAYSSMRRFILSLSAQNGLALIIRVGGCYVMKHLRSPSSDAPPVSCDVPGKAATRKFVGGPPNASDVPAVVARPLRSSYPNAPPVSPDAPNKAATRRIAPKGPSKYVPIHSSRKVLTLRSASHVAAVVVCPRRPGSDTPPNHIHAAHTSAFAHCICGLCRANRHATKKVVIPFLAPLAYSHSF